MSKLSKSRNSFKQSFCGIYANSFQASPSAPYIMSTASFDLASFKRNIAIKNLDYLAQFDVPSRPTSDKPEKPEKPDNPDNPDNPDDPDDDSDERSPCNPGLDLLTKWSNDNKGSIEKAINAQAYGGKDDIHWNIAFLPFLESTAVYLRDWGSYSKAWETYLVHKSDKTSDKDKPKKLQEALDLYFASFKDIEALAKVWNMEFIELCDLTRKSPEGHPDWDGPYCGAFFTTEDHKKAPFIGVAFKGTNPLNKAEVAVDYNYDLSPAQGYLGDEDVSKGVYTGLFGDFGKHPVVQNGTPPYIPYKGIRDQLHEIAKGLPNADGGKVRIHVTGHSLGGSYASFCYAQVLIDALSSKLPQSLLSGDGYTFGAPRVGSHLWAKLNSKIEDEQHGRSWRIVHNEDIVPQIPPTTLKPDQIDFCHVDNGWRIFKDRKPEKIETEQTGPPPPMKDIKSIQEFIKTVKEIGDHSEFASFLN